MSPITPPSSDTTASATATRGRSRRQRRAIRPDLPMLDWWGRLGLLVIGGLVYVGWHTTFYEMWLRWFPGWLRSHWTLSDRLTEGNSYYTHGPLVPVVCLIIAVVIYRRVGIPVRRMRSASIVGWVGLLLSALLHWLSLYAQVKFASGFALIGVLGSLTLIWGGWLLLRTYWLPIAFLTFMVPLPMNWIADLNYQLKFVASRVAMFLTTHVFGVPAVLDGSFVYLAAAADGSPKTLVVEDVCSGLRSLIALMFFATLFAMVCRVRGGWRVVMLIAAAPVAVGCNIIRITTLNVVAHHWGVENAGPGAPVHDLSGLIVFGLALAMMFGIEAIIIYGGRWLNRNWSDPRLLGFLSDISLGDRVGIARRVPVTVLAVAIIAGLSVYLVSRPITRNTTGFSSEALPATLVLDGKTYGSYDVQLEERIGAILQTDDILYRRYVDESKRSSVDTLIVFSANVRNGVHPPQVCLQGGGQFITRRGKMVVAVDGIAGTDELRFMELFTQYGKDLTCHLFIYKYGDRYTPSFFDQQLRVFVSGLFTGDSTGALIRFSTPVEGVDDEEAIAQARDRIKHAVMQLMPAIHRGLP